MTTLRDLLKQYQDTADPVMLPIIADCLEGAGDERAAWVRSLRPTYGHSDGWIIRYPIHSGTACIELPYLSEDSARRKLASIVMERLTTPCPVNLWCPSVINADGSVQSCQSCSGLGWTVRPAVQRRPCPECSGNGSLPYSYGRRTEETQECAACHGTGSVEERI